MAAALWTRLYCFQARSTPKVATSDTLPVLRIFISSTAVDLREYRDKVRDAVLRLQGLPIAMETFSALGGAPAGECMRMAAEADGIAETRQALELCGQS